VLEHNFKVKIYKSTGPDLNKKSNQKGMQQCECHQIFVCVYEPTSLLIKVPTPRVFNCLTVFADSLELITCTFHKLTSKVLASFNNCGVTVDGHKEFKRLMYLCTGTRAKEDTHGFEFQFLKKYQKANDIVSDDAEENKKAKQRKKNDQTAQKSDNEEEEDEHSVLSEGGDDDDSGEEEDVNVTNEE